MCFKTCLLTPIKKKKIFNYFILVKIKDAVLVRKRLTWQRRAEGENRLRHVCLICLLGQMRLTRSEHSLLFSRDKVAAQRRGKDLNCPSLDLLNIRSLRCDGTEIICVKFTKCFFTIFLHFWRANLMTMHLFFQNRQINEVGQPCQINGRMRTWLI